MPLNSFLRNALSKKLSTPSIVKRAAAAAAAAKPVIGKSARPVINQVKQAVGKKIGKAFRFSSNMGMY